VRLVVGTIVGPFGLEGEAKMLLATDDPEHFATLKQVFLGDEPRPRRLLGVRLHKGQALLRLAGVSRPEQVDALRGTVVRIASRDARPLVPGEYFLYQLVGLKAEDETGAPIGVVVDVLETGANDVFVIAPDGGGPDLMVPNHPDFVPAISPETGRIVVRPIRFDG
jgi:16S rRNA processing protein RimM